MSLPGFLISALLALIACLIVAYPLLRRATLAAGPGLRRDELAVAYERVLTNMRDLDEDQRTGKISREEYANEREAWMRRGIEILRALDDHEARDAADAADFNSAIESAIKAYRERLS